MNMTLPHQAKHNKNAITPWTVWAPERPKEPKSLEAKEGKAEIRPRDGTPLHGAVIFHLELSFSLGPRPKLPWATVVARWETLKACRMQLQSDQASAFRCIHYKKITFHLSAPLTRLHRLSKGSLCAKQFLFLA